ncbi:hypothetical protein [Glutamicibacter nicotianae]|uniref:hypothetical protein n=1 Tax=Glutamicibacter nicotianae TaxID=37929 RepID=UPI00167F7F8A|nr:hypothetical protein [Glutamicibacter nicotianae]
MADPSPEAEVTIEQQETLAAENEDLRRRVFVGESIIEELRQALSASQVAQAKANALLKLANQPTE